MTEETLFEPYAMGSLTLANRIGVRISPVSSANGTRPSPAEARPCLRRTRMTL
jgi:hypothetical protein